EWAGQGGGARGVEFYLREGFYDLLVMVALGQLEAGVAVNDRKEVVEVMGDTGSQLADRFHFLGLTQLGFQLFLAGDIEQGGKETRLFTEAEDLDGSHGMADLTVFAAQGQLDAVDFLTATQRLNQIEDLSGSNEEV